MGFCLRKSCTNTTRWEGAAQFTGKLRLGHSMLKMLIRAGGRATTFFLQWNKHGDQEGQLAANRKDMQAQSPSFAGHSNTGDHKGMNSPC